MLKTLLTKSPLREKAGATSSSRFDFQKDWSIYQLLEHHNKESDYLFIFDYHEDLVVMDSESDPRKISFYQIKGKKSGNWTLKKLIESEDDKDGKPLLSILGKLYDCKCKFDSQTQSLNFISNAKFNVKLKDGSTAESKDSICIIEITPDDREKIKTKLISELSLKADPVFQDITFLKVTELSLDASETFVKGRLAEFLESVKPGGKFPIPALYQSLFGEVKRRSDYNKEITTFEELIEKKGIGKSMLEEWIQNIAVKNYDELWQQIESRLNSESVPFSKVQSIRKALRDVEIAEQNPNNDLLKKVKRDLSDCRQTVKNKGVTETLGLMETIEEIMLEYNQLSQKPPMFDDQFIRAIILQQLYD
jgi:hypothetical protein